MENSINFEMDCAFLCNRSKCVRSTSSGTAWWTVLGRKDHSTRHWEDLSRLTAGNLLYRVGAKCVYQKDRLGELIGSRNMRHLQGCKDFECPEGYIKCPKAHCIPVHYLFNDKLDCPIGEDESLLIYKPNFLEGYFNSSIQEFVFLHPDRICHGSTDCL